ncbi:hypothetical protein B6A10_06200 [Flavobacterium sp. L1I52]|uniref:HTH araC/xylS-type domain-containing protein n=1 Tax=Flavobacterium pokkalii TaxID=1940408 RepID=A0ABR7UPI5_9FLAO|nr:AraC family transcriptional regulator [Flavobacterium pokkalii]MBD0724766.1 hypothetical protein [Flavobacterium pokkalii]
MKKAFKQERIVPIYQMLFEMARGNFNSNIPLSAIDDELETLAVLINMVAEEMRESIFHDGFVNTHQSNQNVNHISFIFDQSLSIKSFTSKIGSCLGFSDSELQEQSLSAILNKTSFISLERAVSRLETEPITIVLDFITKERLIVTVSCSISKLYNSSELLLNFDTIVRQNSYSSLALKNDDNSVVKTRRVDAILIQKVYDYIIAHLEEPLPSLKDLSRQFGTNEYKLKSGFRYFFKTSIYQFYNEERLKRAYFMIEHTVLPLKNISVVNGFNNYPNFSKSFKKRFGISPNELIRIGLEPLNLV